MKTQTTQATKLLITGLMDEPHRLDPLTVILEDFEPGKGKIIIECFGDSWSAHWSAMSGRSISQFFSDASAGYLIGKLAPNLCSTRFSPNRTVKLVQREIVKMRRAGEWTKEDARAHYEEAREISDTGSIDQLGASHYDLMQAIIGEEWWRGLYEADEPNPDYLYLERIVNAVKLGLQEAELVAVEAA